MAKRRRSGSRNHWLKEEIGGMPMWGLLAAGALILVFAGVAVAGMPRPSSADPDRTPRPIPSTTSETPVTATEPEPLALPTGGSTVLVMGDSWTAGQSLDQTEGYAPILASTFGWELLNFGERGTGYVNNLAGTGTTYPDRVATLPEAAPGIVIVQGGLNDASASTPDVAAAAQRTLDSLRAKYSETPIVVVGPSTAAWPVPPGNVAVDTALAGVASGRDDVFYISPLTAAWFNEQNIGETIGADSHPTAVGYQIYADQLAAALRAAGS